MSTVLVLGGCGYVGQFVTQALCARGSQVHVTHRPGREVAGLPEAVRCHAMDMTDADSVAAVLREVTPQAVVNCAAVSGLGACEKDPVSAAAINCPRDLVKAVAAEAKGAPRLFVHFSTDIVFDGDPSKLYTEDSPCEPVNTYGRLKADFDSWLAAVTEPTCVVLRPTNIVGPRHPFLNSGTKFLQWLDSKLLVDEGSKLFMDEFRNYVWVEDLVEVVTKLVDGFPAATPPHRVLHCGGPDSLSRVDVAQALAEAKGYSLTYMSPGEDGTFLPRIVPTPRAEVDLGYPSPLCIRFASSRAEEYLGRPMRRIADCLRERAADV